MDEVLGATSHTPLVPTIDSLRVIDADDALRSIRLLTRPNKAGVQRVCRKE